MRTLREILADADARHIAIGHFNISDLMTLRAITEAARELGVPVMVGVSEGEREFMGVRRVAALVKSIREEYGQEVYLNADHTHSLDAAVAAAEAGFDEIIFDASKLPYEENHSATKEAVARIRAINPSIVLEGELGFIGSSSEILSEAPKEVLLLTDPAQAHAFVEETGIDILAPAVGNMHGLLESMVSGSEKKRLNIGRIRELKEATGIYMTLHGGSGTADEDFTAAIAAGITIVHINTELRLEWRRGLQESLAANAAEVAPYKIEAPVMERLHSLVRRRLALFNNLPL